jgi:hypothetical protein
VLILQAVCSGATRRGGQRIKEGNIMAPLTALKRLMKPFTGLLQVTVIIIVVTSPKDRATA